MKRFIFLFTLTLVFSCNKQKTEKQQPTGLSFGNPLQANRNLNQAETNLATAACQLLRDKRERFETLEDNRWEFDFQGYKQDCGSSRRAIGRFTTRLRVPSRGPLHLESNVQEYIDEVLTDRDGFLSFFCDDLLNGKTTTLIKKVGGKRIQLEVTAVQKYIIIGGAWYYPNANGMQTAYLIDKAAVHTIETTRNPRIYGVLKERTQSRACSDGSIKSFQQRLL